ncbi:hypothetical protein HDV04_000412 [Boothiomyces sp. JEL0838]|nr:hypothetical protein HDV04_000392 [Boothiomyces sp. JEL0838]KAJ3314450.1 hypothetical protein HDV04_000412 [Boothiomyces sp. JEL0838]
MEALIRNIGKSELQRCCFKIPSHRLKDFLLAVSTSNIKELELVGMNGDLYASVIKENAPCIRLKKLSLSRTNTTITGLATLLSVINPTTIEYLDLEENEFGNEGAKVVARYLPELSIKN